MRTNLEGRKPSTTEERRQEQICLFRRGDYRNKDHNPESLSLVRVPVKMFSAVLEIKQDKRTVLSIVEFPKSNTARNLLVQ